MPLHEFSCTKCGTRFEKIRKEGDPLPACPACGATEVTKEMSTFSPGGSTPGGSCFSGG